MPLVAMKFITRIYGDIKLICIGNVLRVLKYDTWLLITPYDVIQND